VVGDALDAVLLEQDDLEARPLGAQDAQRGREQLSRRRLEDADAQRRGCVCGVPADLGLERPDGGQLTVAPKPMRDSAASGRGSPAARPG
jgi:hypothetical protein